MYRFTLARVAISFIGGVIAQLDLNIGRTGEGVIDFTLLLDWFRAIVLTNQIRKGDISTVLDVVLSIQLEYTRCRSDGNV